MTSSTLILASALLFVPDFSLAQEPAGAESTPPESGQTLVQDEIEAALLKLADQGALATDGQALTITAPAKLRYALGAVIDLSPDPRGLRVLGVTPGGSFDRVGLRTGDRMLLLNDLALTAKAIDARSIQQAVAERDGEFELRVRRDDQTLTFKGQASTVQTPGYSLTVDALSSGCGRISAFTSMPRSEQLFPLIVRRIDGVEMARGSAANFRLPAGKHVLMLSEAVPAVELNSVEQKQRSLLRRSRMAEYKFFEVNVQPDTTYYLAARLSPYPRDVINNAHWEPVVWKQVKQECR